MFCNACGKPNPDHGQFCSACGAALQARTVVSPTPPQYSAPMPPQPAPTQLQYPVANPYPPQRPTQKKSVGWMVALITIPVLVIGIIAVAIWNPFNSSGSGHNDPGYNDPGYTDPGYNDPDNNDPSGNYVSDLEVEAAYMQAVEAMRWFDAMGFLPLSGDGIERDEIYYYQVNHPTINTMDALSNYLKTLFTDDIVNDLLYSNDYVAFIEIGGKLYQADGGRGGDLYAGEETYSVIRESDTKIIFRVKVEELDDDFETVIGYNTYDMVYEYRDGKWVFSQFELVR